MKGLHRDPTVNQALWNIQREEQRLLAPPKPLTGGQVRKVTPDQRTLVPRSFSEGGEDQALNLFRAINRLEA